MNRIGFQPGILAVFVCAVMAVALASHALPQLDPRDLPPSPFDMTASENTAAEKEMQRMQVDLPAVITNQAEAALVREIRELEQKRTDLENDAYAKDPLLRTYGQYLDKVHDWVQRNHKADNAVITRYYTGSGDPAEAKQRQQTDNTLSDLIQMLLIKELGTNKDFAPLLKSSFEIVETAFASSTNFMTRGSLYWRHDRLIGYRSPTRPERVTKFEDYLAEIDKRYDALTAKVATIQRDMSVPPEVEAQIKYGDLYRMLDGAAECYVDARTPEELRKVREELKREYSDYNSLYWVRKPSRESPK
jgi:hypothetical protein